MDRQRETSLIFSLEGVMARERERIHEEEAEHRRRLQAAHELQVAAERRSREAEERRRSEQERRFREEQQRAREEAARLQALRQAELERSRIEAEARAKLELVAQQHQHERRIEAIRSDVKRRRDRIVALASSFLATLVALGAAALWFGKLEPESARLQAAYDELVSAERRRSEETRTLVARLEDRRGELLRELERSTARLAEAEDELRLRREPRPGVGRSASPSEPKNPPEARQDCADDGDPLNGCLGKGRAPLNTSK
jgi:colicin import membrane protein